MSSTIQLQCVVVQFSLICLCKQLTEHQRMGDVSADTHPSVIFKLFLAQIRVPVAFLTKPSILAMLRNRLRLNDVTLSLSSLLMVLRDLSAWFSIFDTAHLTELGSNVKTGYRRLRSLKIGLFIMLAVSILITILRLPNVESGRRPIMKIFTFYSGLFVLVHVRISQCKF